jgi:hypothetical protein
VGVCPLAGELVEQWLGASVCFHHVERLGVSSRFTTSCCCSGSNHSVWEEWWTLLVRSKAAAQARSHPVRPPAGLRVALSRWHCICVWLCRGAGRTAEASSRAAVGCCKTSVVHSLATWLF